MQTIANRRAIRTLSRRWVSSMLKPEDFMARNAVSIFQRFFYVATPSSGRLKLALIISFDFYFVISFIFFVMSITDCDPQPLISIITVSYNAVATIERTILSVLNQDYKCVEYIIIDGGSTDGTIDIISKYKDRITYWCSEPDKGIYDAMNKGISHANGLFIGLINSDDWYETNTVSTIVSACLEFPDVDVFCGDLRVHYSSGRSRIVHSNCKAITSRMSINHPTCFVRSDVYKKRKFSLKYKLASDYDFLLWCALSKLKFKSLPVVLANFTVGGATFTSNHKGTFEAFDIWVDQLGYTRAVIYFTRDMARKYLSNVKRCILSK